MRIKVNAFPATYFTATCTKHNCWVEIGVVGSTDRSDRHVIGGQLTAIECQVGGKARESNCVDNWELHLSSIGDVTITK